MCVLLAQHNVPLALADHLSPLIRDIFDGQVAEGYACAKTKTSCILNGAIAPEFRSELVGVMQHAPYTLSIDGSNDNALNKMNPLTVRIFDINRGKVDTRFLDMCTTRGVAAATAEAIFGKMNEVLELHNIPWSNCVGVGVDNTSVNIGRHNSIMTRVHQVNPFVYFMGCPCHISHNAANTAAEAFCKLTGFDVEELAIDIFYWFDKSTKRKSSLEEYCCFCDVGYKQVLKHVSTRWLSLETAIERILKLFVGLKSYFLSESCEQARFKRLQSLFSDPLTEICLLFYQSVLPVFNQFNLFLQREDPCIHLVYDHCHSLLRKIVSKFVKTDVIKASTSLSEVDFTLGNQLSNDCIFIGFVTRQKLKTLVNEGDITPHASNKFLQGVRSFYEAAVEYIKAKFPLNDDVLLHARVVNFEKREASQFSDIEYFIERYSSVLGFSSSEQNAVFDEFVEYVLLEERDIPQSVWESAKESLEDEKQTFVRMDVIWAFLSSMKTPDGCNLRFPNLSKVARLILLLPHSNAGEERVFSLIRLNKTPYRSSLGLDGTLSSILTVKLHNPEPCYTFEPSKEMLKSSKKATFLYNQKHPSK